MSQKLSRWSCLVIATLASGAALAQTSAPSPFQRGVEASPRPGPSREEAPPDWRPQSRTPVAPASRQTGGAPAPQGNATPAGAKKQPPNLTVAPGSPAYSVARTCKDGAALVIINVVVKNAGANAFDTTGVPLVAHEEGLKPSWAGRADLPRLAAGASARVSIPLYPPSHLPRLDGGHRFTVQTPWAKTAAPIAVNVPSGVCGALAKRFTSAAVVAQTPKAPGTTNVTSYRTGATAPTNTQAGNTFGAYANSYAVKLPTPGALGSTVDPQVCSNHAGFGGGLACAAQLPQGRLALVWNGSAAAVDGYYVYRVDGGQRARIGRQANGKDVTVYIVDPVPQGGYAGKCYAVSAYRGSNESDLSPAFCAGGGSVVQTVVLRPAQLRSMSLLTHFGPHDFGEWKVGYAFHTDRELFFDNSFNWIDRAAFLFDHSAFASKKIYGAWFRFTVSKTILNAKGNIDHYTSCATRIGTARDLSWQHGDWIEADEVVHPGEIRGPEVSIDVTKIVVGWAMFPDHNHGLVMMGDHDDIDAFTDAQCETSFDPRAVSLEVQYY
jgi:hypothetical protein